MRQEEWTDALTRLTKELEMSDTALFAQLRENRVLKAALEASREDNETLQGLIDRLTSADREVAHREHIAEMRQKFQYRCDERTEKLRDELSSIKYEMHKLRLRNETLMRKNEKLKVRYGVAPPRYVVSGARAAEAWREWHRRLASVAIEGDRRQT